MAAASVAEIAPVATWSSSARTSVWSTSATVVGGRLRWRTVLPLAKHTLDLLALGAAAGAAVALALALAAHVRVARLRRGFRALDGAEGPQSVLEAIGA